MINACIYKQECIYRLASSNYLREKYKHLDCRYQISFVSGVFGIVRTSRKTISTGQATAHSLILQRPVWLVFYIKSDTKLHWPMTSFLELFSYYLFHHFGIGKFSGNTLDSQHGWSRSLTTLPVSLPFFWPFRVPPCPERSWYHDSCVHQWASA